MKIPRPHRRLPFLPLILAGLAVVLLVASVLGWQQWQRLSTSSDQRFQGVSQAYEAAFSTENTDRATRMQNLRTLTGYADKPVHCEGEWWYGWMADVLPAAKQAAARCKAQEAAIAPVVKQAKTLATYLEEEATLQPIIASLAIDGSKSDWQSKALAAVLKAETDLANLKGSKDFETILETTRQQVTTISSRWKALNQASTKHDRKAYEAAVDGVDHAYAGLTIIADTSDDVIAEQLDRLASAAKQL